MANNSSKEPLSGVRVIDHASFVAGPSGGMTLAQLGAEVIRIDPIGGAADYTRWPISQRTGDSLFWNSLNRGKRSVSLNTRSDEGQELVVALITAPGAGGGILLDNSPRADWLAYDRLSARRADVIKVHIQGYADGRGAVDYTVNAEIGMAGITGPEAVTAPVNHVLPAWDLLTGMTATTGLLAALRHRDQTGEGSDIGLALADVALAGLASMGWLTEVDELGRDREKYGNYLYGAYGLDFTSNDGERVMVVALTRHQWRALCKTTGTEEVFATLAEQLGVDWSDEGTRFEYRELITSLLRPWFAARSLSQLAEELTAGRVLWSRYGTMTETVEKFRAAPQESILADIDQPGIGSVIAASSPLRHHDRYVDVKPAPVLGQDTGDVLEDILGLSQAEVGRLVDAGVAAVPS